MKKEKLLKCNLCNFETQSKQGMKTHKTKKHKEVVSHCSFCDIDFTSNRDFHVHMSSVHSGMSPLNSNYFYPFCCCKEIILHEQWPSLKTKNNTTNSAIPQDNVGLHGRVWQKINNNDPA